MAAEVSVPEIVGCLRIPVMPHPCYSDIVGILKEIFRENKGHFCNSVVIFWSNSARNISELSPDLPAILPLYG